MGEVISLSEKREETMPHITGIAICLSCKHEWVQITAVVSAESFNLWFECPECGLARGRYKYQHERAGEHWTCNCGNDLFHITRKGIYCPNCGGWQGGFE